MLFLKFIRISGNIKENENKKPTHSSGPDSAQGLGRLARPSGQFDPVGSGVARRTHRPWSPRGGHMHGGVASPGSPTDKVSREGGVSTVGAAATRLTRWRQRGLTQAVGRREGEEGWWLIDIPRWWRGPVAGEGGDEIL
jgi:hypothetical protein